MPLLLKINNEVLNRVIYLQIMYMVKSFIIKSTKILRMDYEGDCNYKNRLIELVELNDYRYHTRSQTYIYHIGIRFVENRGSLKAISTFQFCS